MLERLILLILAGLMGLLIVYAIVIAPQQPVDEPLELTLEIPEDEWFRENVIESDIPVIVDFMAEWCGPCHMLAPHLEQLVQEHDSKLKIIKINIDQQKNLAEHYQVDGIPFVALFVDGKPVNGFVGYRNFKDIKRIFREQLDAL